MAVKHFGSKAHPGIMTKGYFRVIYEYTYEIPGRYDYDYIDIRAYSEDEARQIFERDFLDEGKKVNEIYEVC